MALNEWDRVVHWQTDYLPGVLAIERPLVQQESLIKLGAGTPNSWSLDQ